MTEKKWDLLCPYCRGKFILIDNIGRISIGAAMPIKEEKKTGEKLVALFENAAIEHSWKGQHPPEDFEVIEKDYRETKKELLMYIKKLETWVQEP